ncbi:MAG TPA: hypothetical protein VGG33_16495 [Polyangia bacterium]
MTNSSHASAVEVTTTVSAELVEAKVVDRRPASLGLFAGLVSAHRDAFAEDVWSIGLRALGNAHAAAQEARLGDIGRTLVNDIDEQLARHVETQQQTLQAVMARFFDPQDGQVTQRLAAFVEDEGVLARLLEKYVAPETSVLAEALARQVGETSPLFRKLSATDSEGLVKVLEGQLRVVMGESHAQIVRALDPLADDGAVARFLRSLRDELKAAEADRSKQLLAAMAALNANDEQSLLSRLVRETQQARLEVLKAVNPEAPDSPLAVLRTSLTALLKEQGAEQMTLARQQQAQQQQFETEVREALARIETKRAAALKSSTGGFAFEDAVMTFLADKTAGSTCHLEITGLTCGQVDRSKKGDAVLRFTNESVFEGAAVVFEAKRELGFTVQKALDELDAARKNRGAAAGVLVLARSHAPPTFPRFARYGCNVLVVWDDEDPAFDPYLQAAVLLGMALVSRCKTVGDKGEIDALNDIEDRIAAEIDRLQKLEKHNEAIRRSADGISDEIRKLRKGLDVLVQKAQSTLRALNVEVREELVERASPIALLPPGTGPRRRVIAP